MTKQIVESMIDTAWSKIQIMVLVLQTLALAD